MSFEIKITSNSNEFTIEAFEPSLKDVFGEESRLTVDVLRSEFRDVLEQITIDNAVAEFFVFGALEFGGRIVDYRNEQKKVTLEIGTFEEDAITAEPTSPTLQFSDVSDTDVIRDAISRVPALSEGTLEIEDSNIDILFSNASPAKMIRQVQRETGNFVRYRPDGSVDYLCTCGTDKTSTVIDPANANVSEYFDVKEFDRESYNHLRVLGASEGDSQISAEAIVSSYDPAVDRQKWRVYTDKEITSNTRAQKVANEIISEYENAPRRIEVETVAFGVEIEVGDRFTVRSDKDDIDTVLTVVEVERIYEGNQDVYEVTFSNRFLTRLSDAEKQRRDVDKFNQSFQGAVVTLNSGGYRAPVDDGFPYELTVRRPPDVVDELTAEVEIDALPYRYYSTLGNHSHSFDVDIPDHTHDVTVNVPSHTHDVTVDIPDHTHDVTVDVPDHTHEVNFTVPEHSHNISLAGHTHNVSVSGDVDVNSDHGSAGYDETLTTSLTTTTGFENLTSLTLPANYEFAILNITASEPDNDVTVRAGNSTDGYFPSSTGVPVWQSSTSVGTGSASFIIPTNIDTIDVEYESASSQGTIEVRALFVDRHDHPLSLTVSEETASSTVDSVTGGQVSSTTTSEAIVNAQTTETTEATVDAQVTETSAPDGDEQIVETTGSGGGTFQSQTTSTEAAISAGIEETTNTPANVDLLVNGNVVATNIGSGEFSEVVDISGQLVEGFNTISVKSDELGHVRATVFQDLYRQIVQ